MIKIEIKEQVKSRREVPRKSDGKIITFYEQPAWAHTFTRGGNPNLYPEAITITLDADQLPYPPGFYTFAPESIRVNRFKQLEIAGMVLRPLPAAAPAVGSKVA